VIFPDSCVLLDYMLAKFTSLMDRLVVYPGSMMRNLELTGGLVFSQRVLLTLTEAGLKREDAYKVVQDNAMAAWNARVQGQAGPDFRARLKADPRTKGLPKGAIDAAFNLKAYLKHVDLIFKRLKL
ncbi:MAG: adenylosuccinate lyase, partial [bacterium]